MMRRLFACVLLIALAATAQAAGYLGDFPEDATVHFKWPTYDDNGASVTRATDGTIHVYKDDATDTESTAGVTDTEDHDSLTGIHHVKIDLSADAFYATGHEYSVVLKAATIDGDVDNAVLASFSIENRYHPISETQSARLDADVSSRGTSTLTEDSNIGIDLDDVAGTLDAGEIGANALTDAKVADDLTLSCTVSDKAGFSLAADQSAVTVGTVTTLTNWHASVTDWTDGGRLDAILDTISGNSTSILADTGTDGVVVASGSKTGFSLAAAGLDLVIVKIDGVNTTLPNAVKLGVRQLVGDMAIVGTTMTYSDADGNIVVYTLNHATTPTARTRN